MIQALGSTIIVKPLFLDTEQVGSIILPKYAPEVRNYHLPVFGEVISIGPRYRYHRDLKVGDIVVWENYRSSGGYYEGVKFEYEGKTYLLVKEKWLHAVVIRQSECPPEAMVMAAAMVAG